MILARGQKYVVITAPNIGNGKSTLELMAIPDWTVPQANTKAAHHGKPYQHNLRVKDNHVIERRTVTGGVEEAAGKLTGLVTPFNTWTQIGDMKRGGFKERVAPGAFAKTLQERDIVLIHNHDTAMPMARTSVKEGPGSLVLREDPAAGLRAEAEPVQTTYAKDVMLLADAGVLRGMSFGFEVIKDEWTDSEGRSSDSRHGTHRTIQEVRMYECTTTAFPAYTTTTLSARDAIAAAREGRDATPPAPAVRGLEDLLSAYDALTEDERADFRASIEAPDEEPETDPADTGPTEPAETTPTPEDDAEQELERSINLALWADAIEEIA